MSIVLLVTLALVLSACSGDDDSSSEDAETPAAQGGGAEDALEITAKNLKFDESTLTAPANTAVTIVFHNEDQGVQHNLSVYQGEAAAQSVFKGELTTGATDTRYEFTTPGPGSYFFQCDVHPDTMKGTLVVE
jgi:plastocyanin